jgi:hypothetical protein
MTKEQVELNWVNDVNLSELPKGCQDAYAAYKAAYATASDIRKTFEAAMAVHATKEGIIAKGQALVFGYRFGKLSLAVGSERAKVSTGKASLSALKA